jgi:hypothetical protein
MVPKDAVKVTLTRSFFLMATESPSSSLDPENLPPSQRKRKNRILCVAARAKKLTEHGPLIKRQIYRKT